MPPPNDRAKLCPGTSDRPPIPATAVGDSHAVGDRHLTQLCAILSSMPVGLVIADTDGNLLEWNPAALRMHGYEHIEDVRRNLSSFADELELSGPEGPPISFSEWPLSRVLRGETLHGCELLVRRKGSPLRAVISYSGARVPDPAGGPDLVYLTLHDVTAQRRAEAELRASETLFRGAFEDTNVPMVLTDLSHRFIRVNTAFARLFGYTREEMLGLSMPDITYPDDLAASFQLRENLLGGEASFVQQKRYVHRDGRILWGSTNVSLVRDAGGRPWLFVGQIQDITDHKLAADALRTSESRNQAFFDSTTVAIVEVAPDGRYLRANGAFFRMFGYSPRDLTKLTVRDVVFPEDREEVLAQYRRVGRGDSPAYEADRRYRRKDGSTLWARVSVVAVREESGRPEVVTAVVVDMTEAKKLAEQFRQAQKMEAVGRLAGGVAHDFNNLLTVINGYGQMLLDQLPPADPARELVQGITGAGERAAGLTTQLLAFSRKAVVEPRVLDLNEVISQSARLLRRLIGEDVSLTTSLAPDLGWIKADPTQVEQVIMNLAVNAKDAMPRGGKLTIETRNKRLRAEDKVSYPDLPPGPYTQLAVSDTGVGMTEEVKSRLFEPFFTTKEAGKGTGLGLAVVHGAVKQNGGRIDVYSELGIGTTFNILFPSASAEPAGSSEIAAIAPQGTETVLLVEDEEGVRKIGRLALEMHGYTVLEAASGEEALRMSESFSRPIDLLVTDVVMPRMGGREVAEALRCHQEGLRVLYVSGYPDDAVVGHGIVGETDAFLQKPFTPMALARNVRAVLDGAE